VFWAWDHFGTALYSMALHCLFAGIVCLALFSSPTTLPCDKSLSFWVFWRLGGWGSRNFKLKTLIRIIVIVVAAAGCCCCWCFYCHCQWILSAQANWSSPSSGGLLVLQKLTQKFSAGTWRVFNILERLVLPFLCRPGEISIPASAVLICWKFCSEIS